MRETSDREFNSRFKAVGGISKNITNLGKYLERDQDEVGKDGAAFVSTEAEVCRHASNIDGVKERSEGGNAY